MKLYEYLIIIFLGLTAWLSTSYYFQQSIKYVLNQNKLDIQESRKREDLILQALQLHEQNFKLINYQIDVLTESKQ